MNTSLHLRHKKAVTLPQYLSNEYARELQRNGKQKVDAGEETFFNNSVGFWISGNIHPNVLKR